MKMKKKNREKEKRKSKSVNEKWYLNTNRWKIWKDKDLR